MQRYSYSVKRFSSSKYSPRDYERANREDFEYDIDTARRGRENQELDEEAERIRWRSDLKKYKSRKGKTAAILGGPGGIAGKWVGDKVADAADKAGKTDEEIKDAGNVAGTIAGIGAGVAAGYGINKAVGVSAQETINKANKELDHLEGYKKDIHKYTKMTKQEKANLTHEINRQNQIIKANTRRANVGKYAMPVLGVVGAIGAAKAINDSLGDRLSKRKAADSEYRRKAESHDKWNDFKDKASSGLKKTGRYLKSIVTEDYRKDNKKGGNKKED